MSRRIKSWNTFETQLDGGINSITDTITFVSVDNLSIDTYLIIDPDTPAIRDFVYVVAINPTTKEVTVRTPRPEEGSFAGLAYPHDDRAVVRAVPVHQWLDAMFDDVDDIEAWQTTHAPGTDPHPQYLDGGEGDAAYLRLDGTTVMAADVDMGDNQITNMAGGLSDKHAVNLLQMQTADTAILDAANAHSDGLDHDHATPIGVHAGNSDVHHAKVHDAGSADHTSGGEAVGRVMAADGVGGVEWVTPSAGVTDHGALTGLGDDDHTQYHNNARGDARYYTKGQVDSLLAGKAPTTHNHTAAQTTSGTFLAARIPLLNANKITSGTFGAGAFTFPGLVGHGSIEVAGSVVFTGLGINAAGVELRLNAGVLSKAS